ncbi:MAG: ABC transporter permease subunit [Gudongella sp.]|nr:ABC transporter permease subunit [Gudongella sp.]
MKDKLKPYILLSPVLLIIALVFLSGIIMAIVQSFGYFRVAGLNEFTLRYYREVLGSDSFLSSLSFSLYTSLVSSIVAVIFGVLLANTIAKYKNGNNVIKYLYGIPIIVPHIVSVLLVYNILSNTGVLPRILYGIGIINSASEFPSLLYDENGIGIIITYLWKEIPFVAFTTYTVLARISDEFLEVASDLGATNKQAFFHVTLPLLMPSILSSFIIIFAFSFGAYEVPLLLGPTKPKALAVQAFIEYSNPVLENRPYAMVINVIITFISFILASIYYRLFQKIHKY